jgi:4-hydroxy-tetrahydrodipicolinate reductase
MDFLPICLTTVSREVHGVHVQRVVNASTRRGPLQKKIGSGLAPEEFQRLLEEGKAGHAGLQESLALIAHCLGWKVAELTEVGRPIVADYAIGTEYVQVNPGQTCGLHQRAEAKVEGRTCLTLDLKMYLEAKDPHDAIQIEGDPSLDVCIKGGVAGDQATVAALVNAAQRLSASPAGLRLVTDLPLGGSASS